MRRVFALLGMSAALVVALLSLFPSQAAATVDGPCTASIGNVDVTNGHADPDGAVPLQSGTEVPVAGTARSRVTDLSYTVQIAGGGVEVGSVVVARDGLSWSGTVDLASISNVTVGLFEVTLDVETASGLCTGTAYVCIEGRNPITTVSGAGATFVGLGGAILLVLSLIRARWMGLARSSLQGFAGGATAGLGGAVLLQQFCTRPLTLATAVGLPLVIGGVGAIGAIGASLIRREGTREPRPVAQPGHGHGAGGASGPAGETSEEVHRGAGSHDQVGAGRGPRGRSASAGGPSPAQTEPHLPAPPTPSDGAVVPSTPALPSDDGKTCRNCGQHNGSSAGHFCTRCGEPLT